MGGIELRFHNPLVIALIAAVMLVAGCNSTELTSSNSRNKGVPCTPSPGGEPRRITPAEVKTELDKGTALVIDVRGAAAYETAHIKGSRQIPYADIASRSDELPLDKLIVTYCS